MTRRTAGFTMVELVIAILIGSILIGIALSTFQNVQSRTAVRGAKHVYMTWHQRARSRAIEMGGTVIMVVSVSGDSTAMFSRNGGTWEWTDIQKFDGELGVDLRTATGSSFMICMTPRGYADESCGALGSTYGFTPTFADTVRLQFWQGGDSASVLILPMGQLIG